MKTIEGVITKVISHKPGSGQSIILIKGTNEESAKAISEATKGRNTISVLGTFFNPVPGGLVTCDGNFKHNQRFGMQYIASSIYSTTLTKKHYPKDIMRSALMRSLDKTTRESLIKAYGDMILRILITKPEKMIQDRLLTQGQLDLLKKDWNRAGKLFKTFDYLRGLGLERGAVDRVIEAHGNNSKSLIANNPYSLLDVSGVGFKSIDTAATNMGMEMTSWKRVRHGLKYIINNFAEQGHTAFYLEDMVRNASREMRVEPSVVQELLIEEVKKGKFTLIKGDNNKHLLVDYSVYKKEIDCAKELRRLIESPMQDRPTSLRLDTGYLKEGQQNAVKNSIFNKFSIITGGPGVGKTTVIKSILKALEETSSGNIRVLQAAPTGKAARRMSESTGEEAFTLHTLLEFHPDEGFRRNAQKPLDGDTIIIDEASMVDINLFYAMLKSIPSGARVIIVGDVDQLESVGPGSVLSDIIKSGVVKVSRLTEVMRQAADSNIVSNAHRINNGQMPEFTPGKKNDFHWIDADSDEKIMETIKALSYAIPDKYGLSHDSIQVLSPQKATMAGVDKLNVELRKIMNPKSEDSKYEFISFGQNFRVNDRIMQVRNNKDLDINNGEVGKIKFLDYKGQKATVDFDGTVKVIPFLSFGDVRHAYAKTIHKSQGSEYDAVIIPVSESHSRMLTTQLLYTALTRGKKHVFMVGSKAAMEKAVKNVGKQVRHTLLDKALINEMGSSIFTPLIQTAEEVEQKRAVANGIPEPNF